MNTFAHWISPEMVQLLSWTLVHFLWQGAVLAALLWLALTAIRNASGRYVASAIVLVLMLAAPVFTFVTLACRPSKTDERQNTRLVHSISTSVLAATPAAQQETWSAAELNITPWLVQGWLVGVLALSLRSAGGLLLLGRLRRRNARRLDSPLRDACLALQRRLQLRRLIEYCESREIDAPAVIGWFRPVILLPISAVTRLSREQLEAVIAHELAHIKRLDAFVNLFQVFVESVLFYHPAVWWVSHQIRTEREHCCDDAAVAVCGDRLEYARALTLMEGWRAAPRLAMAANSSSLPARVKRLLGMGTFHGTRAFGFAVGLMCLGVALLASTALLDIAPAASAAVPELFAAPSPEPGAQVRSPDPNPNANPEPTTQPEVNDETQAPVIAQAKEEKGTGSYIDGLKSAGLENLDVDKLVGLKVQGVTPEYVRELRAAGVELTPERVIALKVQDVTPEYVREMKALGLQTDANNLVAMKVQDITPQYVRAMQAAGLNFDTGKLIGMKVQDITPEYIQQLHTLGLNPTADEAIATKVQDISREYIRDMRAMGLNPSINQLIAMKVQDITPEYVKALQQLGLKLTADQFVAAKVQNITPEFVERVQRHGFHDLNLDKLMELRRLNIISGPAEL
jgi:beta-lactamase regulating signal transducer with metallopeptidase domain